MEEPIQPQETNYIAPLPNSTLALISLIAGIAGFTVFPIIGSIVAIITGYMARQETRTVPPKASGDGMATAGIIMGFVELGLAVVAICCFVLYFAFVIGWVTTNQ